MEEAEFLKDWISRLQTCNKAIVVEGKRDVKALRHFRIKYIYPLSKPLYAIAEHISAGFKKAIILTDLDSEGKFLYRRLKTELTRLGVEVDNRFREELFKYTKLTQIEGFDSYYERVVGEK